MATNIHFTNFRPQLQLRPVPVLSKLKYNLFPRSTTSPSSSSTSSVSSTLPLSTLPYIAFYSRLLFSTTSPSSSRRTRATSSLSSTLPLSPDPSPYIYMTVLASFQKSGFNYHRFIMNRTKSGLYYHHLYYLRVSLSTFTLM